MAEFLPVPDAEQDSGTLQQQVLHPAGNVRLQVLIVDQAHNEDGLREADDKQCHAHHKIDACGDASKVSGLRWPAQVLD